MALGLSTVRFAEYSGSAVGGLLRLLIQKWQLSLGGGDTATLSAIFVQSFRIWWKYLESVVAQSFRIARAIELRLFVF